MSPFIKDRSTIAIQISYISEPAKLKPRFWVIEIALWVSYLDFIKTCNSPVLGSEACAYHLSNHHTSFFMEQYILTSKPLIYKWIFGAQPMCNWEPADKQVKEIPGHDGRLCSCMKILSSEHTEILHKHMDFKNSKCKLKSKNKELQVPETLQWVWVETLWPQEELNHICVL